MNRHPHTKARARHMAAEVALTNFKLDHEAQKRRDEFRLLDAIVKSHDFQTLVEMNGEKCASRQIFRLHTYDYLKVAA